MTDAETDKTGRLEGALLPMISVDEMRRLVRPLKEVQLEAWIQSVTLFCEVVGTALLMQAGPRGDYPVLLGDVLEGVKNAAKPFQDTQ